MVTVFTPTYNRAALLPRLYDSLVAQTSYDFEWLVIDDGSTDNTEELVKALQREQKIHIRYIRKENGGKHTAYNRALEEAAGEWFVCLDSDDQLACDGVETILTLPSQAFGLIAYKDALSGDKLGTEFPADVGECTSYDLYHKHGCRGEYVFVMATELAKRFPFPVFPGEKFVTESVVYDRIDGAAVLRLVPKTLMLCEYQEDGLSNCAYRLLLANPTGYQMYHAQRIDLVTSFPRRLRHCVQYQAFRWLSGNKTVTYSGPHRALAAAMWLPGALGALYYKMKKDQ